jgi:chromate transporter
MLQTWWEIFYITAKVGIFGYGGGPSIIPLFKEEVVPHLMEEGEFIDSLAMGNTLPGPIATKMSAYLGYKLAGLFGATIGVLGMVLPSTIAMLVLTIFFFQFKDHPISQNALRAVRPAVVGLLLWTVWDLRKPASTVDGALIAVGTFIAIVVLDIHPAVVVLAAAVLGVVVYR